MLKAAMQYSFLLQQNVLEPLYVGLHGGHKTGKALSHQL